MRVNARVARIRGLPTLIAGALVLAGLTLPAVATARSGHHGSSSNRADAAKSGAKGKKGSGKSTSSKEKNLEASIVLKLTPPEESLPQTNQINLFVPERFRDAGASMPSCTVATLRAKGPAGCPKKTKVGSGISTGYTILGGQFVIEHLTVTIFNGPGGILLTWVEGRTPVEIEEIVEGKITKPGGFGEEMSFTIPQGLLEPLPGAPGWLQTLDATLSGKSGWLRTTSCPEHPWKLKAELGYLNGQGTSIEATLKCV
ncbi:MAG TPA: hypothetical protein VGF95_09740 [Solirubrobacteraceae bacterium]